MIRKDCQTTPLFSDFASDSGPLIAAFPFTLAVVAGFSGDTDRVAINSRNFTHVTQDNFDQVMAQCLVEIHVQVDNVLAGDNSALNLKLRFDSLADFEPKQLAKHIQPIQMLLNQRDLEIKSFRPQVIEQLKLVLHHPHFQAMEARWRGLKYLVDAAAENQWVEIEMFDLAQSELAQGIAEVNDLSDFSLFRHTEDLAASRPIGVFLTDYEFDNKPTDLQLLEVLSWIGSSTLSPVIAAPTAQFLKADSFESLAEKPSFARQFEAVDYVTWRSLRDSDEAQYLVLALPKVLGRSPYDNQEIGGSVEFEEDPGSAMATDEYLWMSASFAIGTRLISSFARDGWCVAIEGDQFGNIDGIAQHALIRGVAAGEHRPSIEVELAGQIASELAANGFAVLEYNPVMQAPLFGRAVTVQKHTSYADRRMTETAAHACRFPVVMAISRLIQHAVALCSTLLHRGDMPMATIQQNMNEWLQLYIAELDGEGDSEESRPLFKAECELKKPKKRTHHYDIVLSVIPAVPGVQLSTPIKVGATV